MRLYALHGMLGVPQDWGTFFPKAICPFLFEKKPAPFKEWAANFNSGIDPHASNILIGYSMGGRLALQALIHSPQLWQGVVLISTKLETDPDRVKKDLAWANQFTSLSWEELMEQWNSQKVFEGTHTPQRDEKDFNRQHLSEAFIQWSTGLQGDLLSKIAHLKTPLLWLYGEKEKKPFNEPPTLFSRVVACPHAGHRLQWDNPLFFKQTVTTFIEEILHANHSDLGNH